MNTHSPSASTSPSTLPFARTTLLPPDLATLAATLATSHDKEQLAHLYANTLRQSTQLSPSNYQLFARQLAKDTLSANPSQLLFISIFGEPTLSHNHLATLSIAIQNAMVRNYINAPLQYLSHILSDVSITPCSLQNCQTLLNAIDESQNNQQLHISSKDYLLAYRSKDYLDELLWLPLDQSQSDAIKTFLRDGGNLIPSDPKTPDNLIIAGTTLLELANSHTPAGNLASLWLQSLHARKWGNQFAFSTCAAAIAQAEAREISKTSNPAPAPSQPKSPKTI